MCVCTRTRTCLSDWLFVYRHMSADTYRGQQGAPDLLELELGVIVVSHLIWELGT